MKRYFLVTTDHLADRLWFWDEKDFRVAMNYVVVSAFVTGVTILAFILMSNHVHFVLSSSRRDALEFIHKFKRLYAAYYQKKYGVNELLRRNGVDIQEVLAEDESLERSIAYVLMNSVAANICQEPSGYPWGSGNVLFNQNPLTGVRLGDLSRRAQIRLLKSNVLLPQDYLIVPDGYVSPRSYIPEKGLEGHFRTPNRLNFFLRTSSKARTRMEKNAAPSFQDQIILAACGNLCQSLFRVKNIQDLEPEQKADLLRQLARRFSADINQLCRVTGIPYAEAAKMLDSY